MKLRPFIYGTIIGIAAGVSLWLAGYAYGKKHIATEVPAQAHQHQWGLWGDPDPDDNNKNPQFIQFRQCTNCGLSEFRVVRQIK